MKEKVQDFIKVFKETYMIGHILRDEKPEHIEEIRQRMIKRNYRLFLPVAVLVLFVSAFFVASDLGSGFYEINYPYSMLNMAAEITHLSIVIVVIVNFLGARERSLKVQHAYSTAYLLLCSVGCSLYSLSDAMRGVVSSTPYLSLMLLVIVPVLFQKEFWIYYGIYTLPTIVFYVISGHADVLNIILLVSGYILHRYFLASYVRESLVNMKYEESHEELMKMNHTDFLTRIGNRKLLYETIEQNRERWIAEKKEICLIMMDIDHFKCYNDTFSHLQGDNCLVTVAFAVNQSLAKHPIPEKTFIRFGGEEFLVMLVGEHLEQEMYEIYSGIRENMDLLAIPSGKGAQYPYVTISAGAKITPYTEELVIEELLLQADEQLYKVKAQGRNALGYKDRIIRGMKEM